MGRLFEHDFDQQEAQWFFDYSRIGFVLLRKGAMAITKVVFEDYNHVISFFNGVGFCFCL